MNHSVEDIREKISIQFLAFNKELKQASPVKQGDLFFLYPPVSDLLKFINVTFMNLKNDILVTAYGGILPLSMGAGYADLNHAIFVANKSMPIRHDRDIYEQLVYINDVKRTSLLKFRQLNTLKDLLSYPISPAKSSPAEEVVRLFLEGYFQEEGFEQKLSLYIADLKQKMDEDSNAAIKKYEMGNTDLLPMYDKDHLQTQVGCLKKIQPFEQLLTLKNQPDILSKELQNNISDALFQLGLNKSFMP